MSKKVTIKDVAERFELHPTTVKEIDKTFLEKDFAHTDYTDLKVLAMDEIAVGTVDRSGKDGLKEGAVVTRPALDTIIR